MLRTGGDKGVFTVSPAGAESRVRAFPLLSLAERGVWAAGRRLPFTRDSRFPQALIAPLVGRALAAHVVPSTIFHGLTTLSLESIERLQGSGTATLVEHNVIHAADWQERTLQECEVAGIHPSHCQSVLPTGIARRMVREYEECGVVIVRSTAAQLSFERFGCRGKAAVVWAGVDPTKFVPAERQAGPFRALFVGRLELGKGIHYLLDAWKHFAHQGELVLIGEVRHELRRLLQQRAHPSVRVLGAKPPDEVAAHMRSASAFVMPSVNDALPRAVLEAMSSGLPIVATETSGAGDCVANGVSGFVVPGRDAEALADSIAWLHDHPLEARAMGAAARKRVLEAFTVRHYEERQMAMYKALLAGKGAAGMASPSSHAACVIGAGTG